MSVLSCLDSIKINPRNRSQSRRLKESQSACGTVGEFTTSQPGKISTHSSQRLYNVEVLEEEQHQVKIHYMGYSSRHDEWI